MEYTNKYYATEQITKKTYTYLFKVNNIYENTFQNDPDVRITIKLKNCIFIQVEINYSFLFLVCWYAYLNSQYRIKNAVDAQWSNASVVGLLGNNSASQSYQGRQVLLTLPTLEAFKTYLNDRFLTFTYDYAIGLTKHAASFLIRECFHSY